MLCALAFVGARLRLRPCLAAARSNPLSKRKRSLAKAKDLFLVGRTGFEPVKAQGQLIYSQPRLTASLPALTATQCTVCDSSGAPGGNRTSTYGLQNRCSTIELRGRTKYFSKLNHYLKAWVILAASSIFPEQLYWLAPEPEFVPKLLPRGHYYQV
jgi:hypothetical protein